MNFTSATSQTKPAIWRFTVSHARRPDKNIRACGSIFYTDTAEEIYALAKRSGLEVKERRVDKLAVERDGACPVQTYLEIQEPENSRSLHEIIQGLRSSYGVDLAQDCLIPNEHRYFFRIQKVREFTKEQIEHAKYLWVHANKFQIGTWLEPTDEEYSKGIYAVANDGKQGTQVQFGFLSPFPAIGVNQKLKEDLERRSLAGLHLNPITVRRKGGTARKPIWNLTSSIVLPRTLTRFINKHGHDKTPFDDWSDRWESARFHDEGYEPPLLKFAQDQLDALGKFDVAKTAERFGNGPRISFSALIVSQRFRQILIDLNIPGVDYTPVTTD